MILKIENKEYNINAENKMEVPVVQNI
jgi:hypothetical protein